MDLAGDEFVKKLVSRFVYAAPTELTLFCSYSWPAIEFMSGISQPVKHLRGIAKPSYYQFPIIISNRIRLEEHGTTYALRSPYTTKFVLVTTVAMQERYAVLLYKTSCLFLLPNYCPSSSSSSVDVGGTFLLGIMS